MPNQNIILVSQWTNPATGETIPGGKSANVDPATARVLIARGKARAGLTTHASHAPDTPPQENTPPQDDTTPTAALAAESGDGAETTEVKPTGSAKPAQAKGRSTNKEVPADG